MKHRQPTPGQMTEALSRAIEKGAIAPTPRSTEREERARLPLSGRVRLALFSSPTISAAATRQRRGFPIMAYVGPNGGGKSLAMVKDTVPSLRAGRRVLSTVRLLDAATGEPH